MESFSSRTGQIVAGHETAQAREGFSNEFFLGSNNLIDGSKNLSLDALTLFVFLKDSFLMGRIGGFLHWIEHSSTPKYGYWFFHKLATLCRKRQY